MRGNNILVAPGAPTAQFPEYNACNINKACRHRDCRSPSHQYDDGSATCVATHVFSYRSMAAPADQIQAPVSIVKITAQFVSGLGDSQVVTFDLVQGTSVTVPGCTFRASVDYPAINGVAQPSITVFWTMGAGDSHGSQSHARFTQDIGNINNAATSAAFAIPKFADRLVIENDAIAIPTAVLTQLNANNTVISIATVGKDDQLAIPIASGAVSYTISNTGNAPASFRASWRLIF